MSEEYRSACALHVEVLSNVEMCVSMPLGPRSLLTKVVRAVDVIVENKNMPIDMLVLPMSELVKQISCFNRLL